ncbi:MAG: phosphoglycerate mutase family protein [Steroidobacteraceae bacterium]
MPSQTTVPAVDPPAITRRHRPFLAPVWLGLLAAVALAALGVALWASASNTLVVIVPAALGQIGSIANPPLSASGGQQAQRIAQRFATATGREGLDAIYVGDTRRAQQTAAPLAQLLGLKPVVLARSRARNMAGEILGHYAGGTLLVVCNRQFIAALIRALSGKRIETVAERDMYVVSIPRYGAAKILRMRN